MMPDEEQMKLIFGEQGLANLKAHAESLNMSFPRFVFMANFEPDALVEMLQARLKQKQQQLAATSQANAPDYNRSGAIE